MTEGQDEDRTEPIVLADRYELAEPLGAGGMARVYLARDRELDRQVAIKLVPSTAGQQTEQARRMRREARAVAALNHPSVVAIHDIGLSADSLFIVMEHVEGETLRSRLSTGGALPTETAAAIAAEVCSALEAAHLLGIVHRDISPGNIMICHDETVKVLDFGIAATSEAGFHTATGTVLGTPAYLSPEQAHGRHLDARSDLYSLGCCLYEMVTGQPPFTGSSPLDIAYQHVNDRPPSPRSARTDIPAQLETVILRALAKDPSDRYPDAGAMRAELTRAGTDAVSTQAFRGTRPLPASTTDGVTEDRRGVSRRRVGSVLIAIAVAAIVISTAALVYQVLTG